MAYAKRWMPPVIPLRDNLEVWKTLFKDVHQNILDAGLVQSETPGQLDFDEVDTLPDDGSFAGFIEYEFDDELQAEAPVVIKLEYGCGKEGLSNTRSYSRPRTPRIKVSIKFNDHEFNEFSLPQTTDGIATATSTENINLGNSYFSVSYERGFVGLFYGVGSRNKPPANNLGSYFGCTLAILLQRTVDNYGNPTPEGLMSYYNDLKYNTTASWSTGDIAISYSEFMGADGYNYRSKYLALRQGMNDNPHADGETQVQQIFAATPKLAPFPWVVTYAHPDDQPAIPEGTEFGLEVYDGVESNFIAIGRETGYAIDNNVAQRAGIAILFEDDEHGG